LLRHSPEGNLHLLKVYVDKDLKWSGNLRGSFTLKKCSEDLSKSIRWTGRHDRRRGGYANAEF